MNQKLVENHRPLPFRKFVAPDSNAFPRAKARAFSLIEVVIASTIFVVLAAGVLSTAVMARRSMNQALIRNIAFDAAQGFLDQIKGMNFSEIQTRMANSAVISLIISDVRNQSVARVNMRPNAADFTRDAPDPEALMVPINSIAASEADSADSAENALESMSYIPHYGLRLTLTPVTDVPPPNADGSVNAIRVTVNFRYKYSPGAPDSEFKTGAVSYLVPRMNAL